MKYIYCVIIPLLLQVLATYITIQMNTGNGSWIGMLVFFLAMPTVPITAIINATRTKSKADIKLPLLFLQSLLIAFVVPVAIVVLYVLMAVLEAIF